MSDFFGEIMDIFLHVCTIIVLVETDKFIEVAGRNFVTEKQTEEVQIKTRDDNGKPLIAMLYNVHFAPDLCDKLF